MGVASQIRRPNLLHFRCVTCTSLPNLTGLLAICVCIWLLEHQPGGSARLASLRPTQMGRRKIR